MTRKRFDAVIFDLDGTLVDSRIAVLEAVAAGIREVVRAEDSEQPPLDEATLMAPLGRPADEYFRAVLPETLGHLAGRVKQASTRREVEALRAGHGRLFPGVTDALDRLREAGLAIGIVSNAQAPYFRAALRHTGLAGRFDHAECQEELPENTAPPFKLALLGRALDRLGCAPHRAVMAGDRADDLRAGQAAGTATLAVSFGFGGAEELAGATLRLDRFEDLPALVGV